MKKIMFFLIVIVVITAGIFFFINKNKKPDTQILDTDNATLSSIKGYLQETGIVKPQVGAQISIGARATGVIEMLKVKVGDKVKKGELIAKIDSREVNKSIEQIRKSIETTDKEVEQLNVLLPLNKESAKKQLESQKSKLILAEKRYKREKELFEKGFSTTETLEGLETDLDVARNNYKDAQIGYDKVDKEYYTKMNILKSTNKRQAASLEENLVRLSYTNIYSPIDGVVTQVAADEGETVVTGLQVANLITVFNPDMLEMWVYVDETDIGKIKLGDSIEYNVDTYGGKIFNGVINKIYYEPVVKESIVYYLAIVNVSQNDAKMLRPEMTTHVKIVTEEKKDVLTVKNGALKFEGKEQVVYKVISRKENKVERIKVKVGVRGEERTEILKGLNAGDEVAVKIVLPSSGAKNTAPKKMAR